MLYAMIQKHFMMLTFSVILIMILGHFTGCWIIFQKGKCVGLVSVGLGLIPDDEFSSTLLGLNFGMCMISTRN